MEKGEKRGPLKRQRRAQEEGREKGIAEPHQATCNQDVQLLQLIFVSLLTRQLKKDPLAGFPHSLMSVETSAPKD